LATSGIALITAGYVAAAFVTLARHQILLTAVERHTEFVSFAKKKASTP